MGSVLSKKLSVALMENLGPDTYRYWLLKLSFSCFEFESIFVELRGCQMVKYFQLFSFSEFRLLYSKDDFISIDNLFYNF